MWIAISNHSNHKVKYWVFTNLLNQKHNIGWFLLRRFLDKATVCSLHIGRLTLVGQRPMKLLLSICPSVYPTVTKLFKDRIISFSWYCKWLIRNITVSIVFSVHKTKLYGSITSNLEQLWMRKFQCLLFVLKQSYIHYYIS